MELTVQAFLSLDGVMQGPGGPDEDRSGDFDRGGWIVPFFTPDVGAVVDEWFDTCSAILLGRRTFEVMKPYWEQVTDPGNRAATALNTGPKYLLSSTVTEPGWGHTTVVGTDGDAVTAIANLKEELADVEGELQVHGSLLLAQALHAAGLVDLYRLITFPVTVGTGRKLFTADAPLVGYQVTDARVTSGGAYYAVLQPQPVEVGTFAVVDGKESTA